MGTRVNGQFFLIKLINGVATIEGEIMVGSLYWWIKNRTARFPWEMESNLCPLLLLRRKRRTSLSHGIMI